jgi:mono/diheme cytochrome c family protein
MKMRYWIFAMALAAPMLAAAEPNPQIERVWRGKCGSCHGADGKAQTEQGKKMAIADMSTAAWQGKLTDEQIKSAINDGLKRDKSGAKQEMEGYKAKLRPDQIDGLVVYVRALKH